LYCAREESLRKRIYAGTFKPDELHDYFDRVGFYLEEWQWLDMGLAYTATILKFNKTGILEYDTLDLY